MPKIQCKFSIKVVHSTLIGSKFSIIVVLFILHTDWIGFRIMYSITRMNDNINMDMTT